MAIERPQVFEQWHKDIEALPRDENGRVICPECGGPTYFAPTFYDYHCEDKNCGWKLMGFAIQESNWVMAIMSGNLITIKPVEQDDADQE